MTERGMQAARQSRTQSAASPEGKAGAPGVAEDEKVAAGAEQAQATAQREASELLKEILSLIDSKPDISDYERGDQKKVEDLGGAILKKDEAKADQIQSWLSKYAPESCLLWRPLRPRKPSRRQQVPRVGASQASMVFCA
jgi:hypothetical protein